MISVKLTQARPDSKGEETDLHLSTGGLSKIFQPFLTHHSIPQELSKGYILIMAKTLGSCLVLMFKFYFQTPFLQISSG